MKRIRLALLVALLAGAAVAPSFAVSEGKYWKITCPDGTQHVILGTYEEAKEFAGIVC